MAVSRSQGEFGAPRLPKQQLQRGRLDPVCSRVLGEYDGDALWALADASKGAEHGTMLVISQRAADAAQRLASQAILIGPATLDRSLVSKVTGIDGSVLVDPAGDCYAIGVILDGTATSQGDRSRGAIQLRRQVPCFDGRGDGHPAGIRRRDDRPPAGTSDRGYVALNAGEARAPVKMQRSLIGIAEVL
jgi:hypothetical protein